MNEQTNEIEGYLKTVMAEISEAATKHDLATIQRLTRKASELQELKEQLVTIKRRIVSLSGKSASAPSAIADQSENGKIRQLPIEITNGMIRQNLLTLASHVRSGEINVGEELVIEAYPSGHRFQTVLLEQGKKLQARSEIASFYRDAKVIGGDYVLLTENAPGRWTLKKAPPGEYGVSRLLQDLG